MLSYLFVIVTRDWTRVVLEVHIVAAFVDCPFLFDIGSIQTMLNQPAGSRIDISRLYQVPSTRLAGPHTLMDRKR